MATLAMLAAGVLGLYGCKPKPQEDASAAPPQITIGAENFTIVTQGRLQTGPAISGTLTPKAQATIRAQAAGAVMQTYVEQGERVGAGALMARLDDRAVHDAVVSAQSSLTSAKNAVDLARREEERQKALAGAGAVSQREVENARRTVVAAEAQLAQAQSQLVSAQKQATYSQIRAPFSGIVSEKQASTGDIVQPGGAIFTVVDPSSMQLEASIPAEDLAAIRVGAPVEFTVTGYPDRVFNGSITRINPSADPATRQVRIYAEIPNSGSALVGQLYAEGHIGSESRVGLIAPEAAIDHRMSKPAVMRIRGGKVERVEVTLGLSDERTERVEITSGVNPGDTVLMGAAQQIAAGTLVRVTSGTPQTAPASQSGAPASAAAPAAGSAPTSGTASPAPGSAPAGDRTPATGSAPANGNAPDQTRSRP